MNYNNKWNSNGNKDRFITVSQQSFSEASGNPTDLGSSVAYGNLVFATIDGDALETYSAKSVRGEDS